MTSSRVSNRPRSALAAALALAGALAGCSVLVSTDDLTGGICSGASCADSGAKTTTGPNGDACSANVQTDNANCGTCGNVCPAHNSCTNGSCVAGCPDKTVYVSASGGKDTNDGCTTGTAMATIGAAIAAVQGAGAVGNEIHVCAGDYVESGVSLEYEVSLLGGYSCTTWMRTATYGFPKFDGVNETRVETSGSAATGTTMTVSGAGVTGASKVDGFTIVSPSSTINNSLSVGLELDLSTAVVISNDKIEGAMQTAAPTAGVQIQFSAVPEIANDLISGGASSANVSGVVVMSQSSPYIHDNAISAGASTAGAAVGLDIQKSTMLTGARAVRGNTIDGGSGVNVNVPGSRALSVAGTSADFIGNDIFGGTAACGSATTPCSAYAFFAIGTGGYSLTLAGNRIVGGIVTGGASQLAGGVVVQDVTNAWLVNNAVDAAAANAATEFGIVINGGNGATIQQNTVFGTSEAIELQSANSVSLMNNLLLGTATSAQGLRVYNCSIASMPTTLGSVVDNAFVGYGNALAALDDASCSSTSYSSIGAVEAAIGSAASGNKRVSSDCSADNTSGATNCFVEAACSSTQTSPAACISTVLGVWDDASQGAADLTDLTRSWALATGGPCLISQGGGALLNDPAGADGGAYDDSVDITGTPRSAPVSIGAYEDNLQCQQ